jgi:MFS family permease
MSAVARVRVPVTAFFALDGFLFGNWVVCIPQIKAHIGASAGGLGIALLGISAGAVVTMMISGRLCERFGSASMTVASAAFMSVAVMLPPHVTSVAALAGVLVAFGAGFGGLNVALNSTAVEITAHVGRPIMPSFHAAFSLGGLVGAVVGGALAGVLSASSHLAAAGGFALAVTAIAGAVLLRDASQSAARSPVPAAGEASAPPAGRESLAGRPRLFVTVFGVIALCSTYGEGAMADWGALHLHADLHTSVGLAAAGYASFSAAMVVGRLSGTWLLSRTGRTFVLAGGATLAAVGMLAAALVPVLVIALIGFVLVGLGLANIFPAAIGQAGALTGPSGVAAASTIGYMGLLAGPPTIGFLAERTGLPAALTTVSLLAAIGGIVALIAHRAEATGASPAA